MKDVRALSHRLPEWAQEREVPHLGAWRRPAVISRPLAGVTMTNQLLVTCQLLPTVWGSVGDAVQADAGNAFAVCRYGHVVPLSHP